MHRKIDELGRIVIPSDIRDALNLVPGQELSFDLNFRSKAITMIPVGEYCRFCGAHEKLRLVHGYGICQHCLNLALADDGE